MTIATELIFFIRSKSPRKKFRIDIERFLSDVLACTVADATRLRGLVPPDAVKCQHRGGHCLLMPRQSQSVLLCSGL